MSDDGFELWRSTPSEKSAKALPPNKESIFFLSDNEESRRESERVYFYPTNLHYIISKSIESNCDARSHAFHLYDYFSVIGSLQPKENIIVKKQEQGEK